MYGRCFDIIQEEGYKKKKENFIEKLANIDMIINIIVFCRAVKMVHVADLMIGSTSETVAHLQAIVQDARLADAMVAIDG